MTKPSRKQYPTGNKHAMNSPKTLSSTKDGSSQLSSPFMIMPAPLPSSNSSKNNEKTTKTTSPYGPKDKNMPTKCTTFGKNSTSSYPHQTSSLSPNVYGTTNTSLFTNGNKKNSGKATSMILASAPGERRNNQTPINLSELFNINSPSRTESNNNNNKKRKQKTTKNEKEKTPKEKEKVKKNNNQQSPPPQLILTEPNESPDFSTPLNPATEPYYIPSDAGDDDCPPSPAPVLSPRANDSSAKHLFRVYSHKVNGLRDESKLEYIPRIMEKNKIDAYLFPRNPPRRQLRKTTHK
jgi:hypothetical protein